MFLGIGIGLTSLVVVMVCLFVVWFGFTRGLLGLVDLVRLLSGFCCFVVVVLTY